ncbi:probable hydrolase PNKD [Varanus komodoensis]|uniref:Uncharacterized protein n=1 Tax=Varanus komodoensis TaxID=61221 RepID=A0A8D2IU17_VARKO|nr:probable hydrolase PNKD [Varanus komodoensis]
MAVASFRLQGLLSAAKSHCRAAGLIVHFKTSVRPFHSSCKAFEQLSSKPQPGGQAYEEVKYIPKKKARNPMKTVGIAWAIGFPSGIILFLLTKRQVDKNRMKQLKDRQRMKTSNKENYEKEQYRATSLATEGLAETKS